MNAKTNSGHGEFEQSVAGYYRALGADVVHNIRLGGHQIDILVEERTVSGATVRTAVECKAHARPLGINPLTDLKAVAQDLIRDGHVDLYVVVSRSGFTEAAKDAESPDVKLKVPDDLRASAGLDVLAGDLPPSGLLDAGAVITSATRALVDAMRISLANTGGIGDLDYAGIEIDAGKISAELEAVLDLHSDRLVSQDFRPTVRALRKLEQRLERSLDAFAYLRRVAEMVEEREAGGIPAGGTEADHMAARLIVLRETEQARANARIHVSRLTESVDLLRWRLRPEV